MTTKTDRMGGYIFARIIDVNDIESFRINAGVCYLVEKSGKTATQLETVKNGISVQVEAITGKSGISYSVQIDIDLKKKSGLKNLAFNRCLAILKNPFGEEFVYGTKSFPLHFLKLDIPGNNPAERSGERLMISGITPELMLMLAN